MSLWRRRRVELGVGLNLAAELPVQVLYPSHLEVLRPVSEPAPQWRRDREDAQCMCALARGGSVLSSELPKIVTGRIAPEDAPIRTVSSREVYRNKWSRVREDVIERRGGVRGVYGVMDKDPACILIPLEHTPEGDFITLVHQFRYTVQGSYFELPQGGWEDPDADVEEMARGELREETGLRIGKITRIGQNWIAYGAMRQEHNVYLCGDLTQGEAELEPEEDGLTVHRVSVAEFERMILDGRVRDNCTLAAWGTYLVWKRAQAGG